ncbi:hypothetical protein KAT51_08325 [bacterium]|nr:hypothetical protein [bacterium]
MIKKLVALFFLTAFMVGVLWAEEPVYPKLPLLKPLPLSGMKANKKIIFRLLKDLKSKNPTLRCWAAKSLRELDIQKERGKTIRALRKAFRKEKHPQVKEAMKEVLLKLEGEMPKNKAIL